MKKLSKQIVRKTNLGLWKGEIVENLPKEKLLEVIKWLSDKYEEAIRKNSN